MYITLDLWALLAVAIVILYSVLKLEKKVSQLIEMQIDSHLDLSEQIRRPVETGPFEER